MSDVNYHSEKYKPISDAMRKVLGTEELIPPCDYASKIPEIFEAGRVDKENDYQEVNEQLEKIMYSTNTGGKSFYDEFWDWFQKKGKRICYNRAFVGTMDSQSYDGWVDEIYNPKYPITITISHSGGVFYYNTNITDTKVPIIVTGTSGNALGDSFYRCYKLETIHSLQWDKALDFPSNTSCFHSCRSLKNITIVGEGLITKDCSFEWSTLLTTKSIVNIIEHLSDNVSSRTLTLSKQAVESMVFPHTSEQSGITYNSWNELIAPKTADEKWTISTI